MDFDTHPSLFQRLREGENDASWREFDERYRDLILRYCRTRGVQPDDAEDVRQMVMIGFAHALKNFQYDPARGRFRNYLGRCVAHAIRRRAQARHVGTEKLVGEFAAAIEATANNELDAEWEREWMDHHYRLAMRTVRETFEPLSLEVFESLLAGSTVEEASAKFSLSTQAVHKIKQRVRNRLRELIEVQVALEDGVHEPPGN